MNPTEILADFIVQTGYDDIPHKALERAKWAMADGLAVTLGGWRVVGPQVLSYIDNMGGRPEATVFGAGHKTNPPLAALANAVMSHVLDYDDINESMGGHPTGPVLSAVLALGEKINATGKMCLLAYLMGVETETKLGRAMIKTLYVRGWHPTAVLGVMGSTAACAKLLGLTVEQTITALGIAGSLAGGLKRNFGTMTKSLHVGQAAQNGVTATLLAKNGWTAASDILEGHFGYANLFCGPDGFDLTEMTGRLGDPWDIIDPGIKLKKYPCCGSIHPAVDAALMLRSQKNLGASELAGISCSVHPSKQHILMHPRPGTGLEAKFSLEYCLARAFLDGRISMDHFQDDSVHDEHTGRLLQRISINQEVGLPEWAGRVVVKTSDGATFSQTCEQLPGIDSLENLIAKFNDCVEPVIGVKRSTEVFGDIQRLDELKNISDLTWKLVKESS